MSPQEKLIAHIVSQDRKDDARAMRSGRYHNPHALALMLEAAHKVEAESAGGGLIDWINAVTRNFTATRTMHTFLKKFDPTIIVDHGRWMRRVPSRKEMGETLGSPIPAMQAVLDKMRGK